MILLAEANKDDALRDLQKMELVVGSRSAMVVHKRKWESNRLMNEGRALLQKDLAQAIDKYTLAIRLFPENAEAYLARSGAHYRKNDITSSIKDANRACELGNAQACNWVNSLSK